MQRILIPACVTYWTFRKDGKIVLCLEVLLKLHNSFI